MKEEKKGLVSVIFATMNRKDDLIKCIKSIKNSTYKNVEIIIVDNGSTDGSQELVKKLFPEVILIESELNLGVPVAFNKCLEKASGEYILRLDDDVLLKENAIELLVEELNKDRFFVDVKTKKKEGGKCQFVMNVKRI